MTISMSTPLRFIIKTALIAATHTHTTMCHKYIYMRIMDHTHYSLGSVPARHRTTFKVRGLLTLKNAIEAI